MKLALRAKAYSKKLTLMTTAFVLAVSSLTAAVPFILSQNANAAPYGDVVVRQASNQGWNQASVQTGGTSSFVSDSSAPYGYGALQLTTTNDNNSKVQRVKSISSVKLSDISTLSYWTKEVAANNPAYAASLQLSVNGLNGTSSSTTLVFEPYWNGTTPGVSHNLPSNTWEQWNVKEGVFWSTKTYGTAGLTNGQGGSPFYTLAQVIANNPNAKVTSLTLSAGTYNPGLVGYADGVNLNGTVYDFEPVAPPTFSTCSTTSTQLNTNLDSWDLSKTRANGHSALVTNGLHVWTDGTSDTGDNGAGGTWNTDKVAGYYTTNFLLKDIGTPSIQYAPGSTGSQPGMNFALDIDGDGGFDGYLVAEDGFAPNWWLSEGSTAANAAAPFDGGQPSYRQHWGTPQQWLTAFPNAKIRSIGFSLGSGAQGNHVITKITAGCVDHTFSFVNTAPVVTFEAPTPANNSFVHGTVNGKVSATDDHGLSSYYVRFWKDAYEVAGGGTLLKSCYMAPGGYLLGTDETAECSFDTTTLPEGTKLIFSAQFLDGDNTWGSDKRTYTVDNTAPTLYIKQGGSNVLPSSLPSSIFNNVSFKLFDAGNIDKVTINGVVKDLTDNTWSDVNGVTAGVFGAVEGANTIVVYDTAGNTTTYNFTIDTIAPVVTVTPIAGSLLHGTVTFDITVTDDNLNPSAPSTWVYLYNNLPPQASKGASINLSSGHGTFTVNTALLADGLSSLDVGKLYDAAGNASGVGDSYFKNYVIDNTAPVITVNNLFTIDSTPILTGHVNDTTATVIVKIGSHSYPVTVDSNGDWSAQVSPSLSDGHYNVKATATDPAGNVGNDTTTNELTVDAHIPGAPTILTPTPNGYSNNANTLFTWLGPLFVWNGPAKTQLQVATDSGFANIVVNTTGNAATGFQVNTLADGVYYARMNTTDNLGGTSGWSSTRKFTVDATNPVVAITSPSNGDHKNGTVTLSGTATDTNLASYRWAILDSSNNIEYIHTSYNSTVDSYNWDTTGLPSGEYTIYLRATDSALNSVVTSVVVTVDNTAPAAPSLTFPADGSASTTANATHIDWTSVTDPQGSGPVTYIYQSAYDAAFTNIAYTSTPLSATTIPTPNTPEGTYYVHVMACDALGNCSPYSDFRKVIVDNTAPVISFTASSYNFTGAPVVSGEADDSAVTLKLIVNGGTPIDVTHLIGTGVWSYDFLASIPNGTYNLELVATDEAGNSAYKTATLVLSPAPTTPATPTNITTTPTTPGTPSPAAQGVLGDSTGPDANDDTDNTGVEGASTENKAAQATDTTDANDGTIWGLAWYWWLLILAALAAIIWWIIAALRNRSSEA